MTDLLNEVSRYVAVTRMFLVADKFLYENP